MTNSALNVDKVDKAEHLKFIELLFRRMQGQVATDLYLTVGLPPCMKIENTLKPQTDCPTITPELMDDYVGAILTYEQASEYNSTMELNFAYSLPDIADRFRVSLFRQKNESGMVVRLIKAKIPSFEDLGLPEPYKTCAMKKRGIVLIVGATGSGKSTSLAAMVDFRNKTVGGHIITIEDPIEFVHGHYKSIITQREIGVDTYSYGIALKNALRQAPDVVVIGEIRDRETMESALLFSETGHLVLATIHASSANQAIDRIMNLFPEEMNKRVLTSVAQNLITVMSQRLIKHKDEDKRVLACEIMINEGLVTEYIEAGRVREIKDVLEKNNSVGMVTFDQYLYKLFKDKQITEEVALHEADNAGNLRLKINMDRASRKGSQNLFDMQPDTLLNGGMGNKNDF
jgi:twitching motility protein PilU